MPVGGRGCQLWDVNVTQNTLWAEARHAASSIGGGGV